MTEFYYNYSGRPYIPVNVTYNNQNLDLWALVDSGADLCVSYRVIGEMFFGMKFPKETTNHIDGIDKKVFGWVIPVEIKFFDETFKIDVMWLKKKFDPTKNIQLILGRTPLFDKFDVEFRRNKTMIFRK